MIKISQNQGKVRSSAAWLADLVAFDSRNGTGDEVALAQYMHDALNMFQPDTLVLRSVPRLRGKSDSAYVFASWGTPRILLNVHLDTVPSGKGWDADPLALRQLGDKLIGLGASDIKGAAAAIYAALGTVTPKDVAILFSGDEEHGSEVMPAFILSGDGAAISTAIVCEPTGCRVGRRHRGMLALSTTFTGPGGHSSLSDQTAAPLLQAARLAAAIGGYGDANRDFGEPPYKGLATNIGDIDCDGAYNVIPTTATLKFSLRPPPGDNVAARESDIRAIASGLYPDHPLDTIVAFPSFATKDLSAFAPYFGDFEPLDLPYWTEAAMLSDAGVNAVVYGPGDVDQAHKPNEFVTQTQLDTAQVVYARALSGDFLSRSD
ncbi:M20/M25/M40 family metallo-hydrolase [Fretibacter rubidus]|uniref:M20/M25/M40 family metallo-hydrolase n=1 Tax=Fretibacter rubidus TaxID=570162 RepID=UPI00352A3A70